jgi:hypothetical protein
MKEVREKIADSTAETDDPASGLAKKPNYHCDDEQLTECSHTVKSDTDAGVKNIQQAEYDQARSTIGHVVHTLQDFYSHSNWVEMYGATVSNEMGNSDFFINVDLAEPNESTCTHSELIEWVGTVGFCAAMDTNNLTTHNLTSGYYKGNGSKIPSGVNKCFHGGSFDGYGKQGINKDAAVCYATAILSVISPHADWHYKAVAAAKAATVEYFDRIKDRVSEKDFKNFLGFNPELGFAIDTTTSMTEEIDGVKNTVSAFVKSLQGTDREPSGYVLGIIQDPSVPEAMKTDDASVFLGKLSQLYAGYGGAGPNDDLPELYGQGVYNVISALGEGSTMFVFTDAAAKDPEKVREAMMLAQSKRIGAINAVSYPVGTTSSIDNSYFDISAATGGQVFIISPKEAGQLAQLADILNSGYYTQLVSIDDTLTSGSPKTIEFTVDSTLDTLLISVSLLQSAKVTVLRPDGTTVNSGDAGVKLMSLSQASSYQIDHPAAGTWKIVLDGKGRFTANVGGSSPVSFSHLNFMELQEDTQDPGYFPVQGYPVAGVPQTIEAMVSGDTSDVHFEFRAKDGTLLGSVTDLIVDSTPGAQTMFAALNVNLPTQPFRVYAVGKDANGNPFERVLSNLIVPQTVAVAGPGSQELPQDTDTTYVFKVTNYGAADKFTLSAVDDRGFMLNLTPAAVSIGAGETQEVSVVLHPGAASALGTVSTMTFMALPASDPNALGNYAIVTGTVVAEKSSGPPPPKDPADPPPVVSVPVNDATGLLLLMGLLAGSALWQVWRRRRR